MKWFALFGLRLKVLFVVALASGICSIAAVFVALQVNHVEHVDGLMQKSQAIMKRMEVVAQFVAKQGGLKPIVQTMVDKYKDPSEITDEDKLQILNQVPIYAAMKGEQQEPVRINTVLKCFQTSH
jgi:methyl-accepting chemotaxis protein